MHIKNGDLFSEHSRTFSSLTITREPLLKKHVIDIIDSDADQKSHIVFSETDLIAARNEANDSPITPIIVNIIHQMVSEKGFRIIDHNKRLFNIARNILLGEHVDHIIAVKIKDITDIENDPENFQEFEDLSFSTDDASIDKYSTPDLHLNMNFLSIAQHPLLCLKYDHATQELNRLFEIIHANGKIPVLWRKSNGFTSHRILNRYEFVEPEKNAIIKNPAKMIEYVLEASQDRIVYIFEDFHHYMGKKDVINPHVGEIRSLIKELHDQLIKRSEYVVFFLPHFYEIPEEIEPYIQVISNNQPKTAKGYLDRFGQLLTDPDYIRKCKPVVGVDHLIGRMIQILGQMESNNPLLIGSPGVGKTSIVEGFAKILAKGNLIPQLAGRNLYSLSLNSMVAGTRYRGDFEIRLEGLMDEVLQNKDRIIVFIDEIHTLIDAGSSEGAFGAADVLKPVLARGEFPCIGATTPEGVDIFSKDPALARRFKKIRVDEPDVNQAYTILKGIMGNLERHHQIQLSDDALRTAVELSKQYITNEFLPGKAVALIDGAAAFCRIHKQKVVQKNDVLNEMKRYMNENKIKN